MALSLLHCLTSGSAARRHLVLGALIILCVSTTGNPPKVLTYPGVVQGQILPVFAASFKFTSLVTPSPQMSSIVIQANAVILGLTNLTAGAINYVEKSVNLGTWQPLTSFMPCTAATNMLVDTTTNSAASYRLRVVR